ncbi:MAG TPA: GIY-YIG nuclease family protein [Thermoanaerobaculia bacterium]|nr:GIY-YIG nuclease family protein [Thermoanaerobaculia bacterium]
MKLYYVYILASLRRVLYIGITSDFEKRLAEHKAHKYPRSFTSQYNVTRLVLFEEFTQVELAIAREKQLKGWRRSKKVALIERGNPDWIDLAGLSSRA